MTCLCLSASVMTSTDCLDISSFHVYYKKWTSDSVKQRDIGIPC